MEATQVQNVVTDPSLDKKPEEDSWNRGEYRHDYAVNGQIMVTITLSEYRALVKANADSIVSEARSKTYTTEKERDELKKQVTELQKQLDDLRSMIAGAAKKSAGKASKEGDEYDWDDV